MITIGSLFSGIGGLELGLERAIPSARTVWQVECEPFARRVLEAHWPDADRSVTDVKEASRSTLVPVDVICGGFPCQDISVAGKGAGLGGARSGLWFEYGRIIRDLRPRIVVVENVPALLSRGLGVVLGDLAASGYDAEWDCVPAASVGAPHLRDRLFLVAYPASSESDGRREWAGRRRVGEGETPPDTGHNGREGCAQRDDDATRTKQRDDVDGRALARLAPDAGGGELRDEPRGRRGVGGATGTPVLGDAGAPGSVTDSDGAPRERDGSARGVASPYAHHGVDGWGEPPSAVRRVDDGPSAGVDRPRRGRRPKADKGRLHALGNAVVPQVAEVVGRRVAELLQQAEGPTEDT